MSTRYYGTADREVISKLLDAIRALDDANDVTLDDGRRVLAGPLREQVFALRAALQALHSIVYASLGGDDERAMHEPGAGPAACRKPGKIDPAWIAGHRDRDRDVSGY